eukprot:COSAG05_NODE_2405_length_3103_cov_1.927097_2_plen_43_part_00
MIFDVMLGDMMIVFLTEVLSWVQKLDADSSRKLNNLLEGERP